MRELAGPKALPAPYGCPYGTGVTLSVPDPEEVNVRNVAYMLSMHGCPPPTAVRAAEALSSAGQWTARLMTTVTASVNMSRDLELVGVKVMIEDHVPEHNDDHYHTRRKRDFIGTHPNPDVVLRRIDRVLADRAWNRPADVPRPPVTLLDDYNPRDFRM